MSGNLALLIIKITTSLTLLWPHILLFQSPGRPGRLVINSTPTEGAAITINGQTMKQLTNATFVVPPGKYKLSVKNQDGSISCQPRDFSVSAGQETIATCSGARWE